MAPKAAAKAAPPSPAPKAAAAPAHHGAFSDDEESFDLEHPIIRGLNMPTWVSELVEASFSGVLTEDEG